MKYIDIHGHIGSAVYDADREEVIKRAEDLDIGIIVIGTDLETSKRAVELAVQHKNIWATVGVHPTDNIAVGFDLVSFRKLAAHPKVVAIGECGLDYFHSKPEDMQVQHEVFIKHIELANEVHKPLMLHIREPKQLGGVDKNGLAFSRSKSAYQEAVEIVKLHAKVRSNFHFFTGTKEDVRAILDIGGMFSFTGVVTFARSYDEVIRYIPLDRMMSETDCPYVSPAPYRGKRNEPSYVTEVIKSIATIRGDGEVAVGRQLLENAVKFFGLK